MLTVHEGSTASSFYTFSQSVPIMDGMSGWKGAVRKIDLDAFFQLAKEVAPFHSLPPGFGLVGPQHLPGIPLAKNCAPFHTLLQAACPSGFFLVCREDLHGIPHAHASGRAKNRAPFHLVMLSSHGPRPMVGVQQTGGRVHQR